MFSAAPRSSPLLLSTPTPRPDLCRGSVRPRLALPAPGSEAERISSPVPGPAPPSPTGPIMHHHYVCLVRNVF